MSQTPLATTEGTSATQWLPNLQASDRTDTIKYPSSNLLAALDLEEQSNYLNLLTIFNTTIGHNSIFESTIDQFSNIPSINEVSVNQIALPKISHQQTSSTQVSPTQVSSFNIPTGQIESSKIGFAQVDFSEKNERIQIRIPEIDSTQIKTSEISKISDFRLNKFNSSKISLSSIIEFEQFSNSHLSHNSTPQIINELNNSATKISSDLLKPQTSLDLETPTVKQASLTQMPN